MGRRIKILVIQTAKAGQRIPLFPRVSRAVPQEGNIRKNPQSLQMFTKGLTLTPITVKGIAKNKMIMQSAALANI
jgi:hypothetical protein